MKEKRREKQTNDREEKQLIRGEDSKNRKGRITRKYEYGINTDQKDKRGDKS